MGKGTVFATGSAVNHHDAAKFVRLQGLRKRAANAQAPAEQYTRLDIPASTQAWATAPDFSRAGTRVSAVAMH